MTRTTRASRRRSPHRPRARRRASTRPARGHASPGAGRPYTASGTTLLELLLALAVVAILATLAAPRMAGRRDLLATQHAARLVADALATARREAMATSRAVAIHLDPPRGALTVHAGSDTLIHLPLATSHRITLRATRDSMAYSPNGLGIGAANLTITIARGTAADTVTVSRLGRVRW